MWIFSEIGFFSAVMLERPGPNDETYQIRARRREDIDHLVELGRDHNVFEPRRQPDVVHTEASDYAYRVLVHKDEFVELVELLAVRVDYANFKGRIHQQGDASRDAAYARVWAEMNAFQHRPAKRVPEKRIARRRINRGTKGER